LICFANLNKYNIKSVKKIAVRTLIGILLFMLLVAILLALPVVQTRLGKYATDQLKEDFGVTITIEKVAINPFGGVILNEGL
jgi:hypothetical protein